MPSWPFRLTLVAATAKVWPDEPPAVLAAASRRNAILAIPAYVGRSPRDRHCFPLSRRERVAEGRV